MSGKMQTPQEEISQIMKEHGISYAWIAKQLSTYPQKIQYAIEYQKEMPLTTYCQIMQVFEEHGYIRSSEDTCANIVSAAFKTNAKFGSQLKKLNDQIAADISDDRVTPEERLRLRFKLEEMKNEFCQEMEAMLAILNLSGTKE